MVVPIVLEVRRVETVPEHLAPRTLYVSRKFEVAIHLCACGCGEQSVTPLDADGWTLDDATTTLAPSILNRPCGAHYFIRDGAVVWA